MNHVYAGRLLQLPKNKENPYGASFTDVNGILPAEVMKSDVIDTASDYVGLHADASFVISQEQNLSLYKQVTADLSDKQQGYVSADEYATASVGGWDSIQADPVQWRHGSSGSGAHCG